MGRLQGDLAERTYAFALDVLNLVDELPPGSKGWELARQLTRSGTSVGANVEEADQALSRADFIHCCGIARKEAKETHYWLRLCRDHLLLDGLDVQRAIDIADEFVRILTTIIKNSRPTAPEHPRPVAFDFQLSTFSFPRQRPA